MEELRHVSTEEPGYTRKPWGRGFTYQDADGETVRDQDLRAWMESIVIPPAWTDVWISPYKNGHILATGRDSEGRKQYRYHPKWQEIRNQKKFDRLLRFGECLPHLRQVTDADLRGHKLSRQRVLAGVVRLLENTLIRIGNTEYAQKNNTYGLTTLTDDHAEIDGEKVVFDFVGKSGKEHTIMLKDARLAPIVQRCQDIPGYDLFQYYDEAGDHRTVESSDVNEYLKKHTGETFTAKVFRTWGGSTLAIKYLCEHQDDDPGVDIGGCFQHVADLLGNTTSVCRQYYVHPLVSQVYEAGQLCQPYNEYAQAEEERSPYDLAPEEKTLMHLIAQDSANAD